MDVEDIKIKLVNNSPEFNTVDAFRFFDTDGKGFISAQQLVQGLQNIGVYFEDIDIDLFFKRFDKDND